MAKCRYCGAETELFELDQPICVKCDVVREAEETMAPKKNDDKTKGEQPKRTASA